MILFVVGILLACVMGVMMILMFDSNKRKKNTSAEFAKYNKKFLGYMNNPLTRNSFSRIATQVSNLSIYNFMEIRILSVKFYTRTLLISFVMFIVGAAITQDYMATIIIALYAMVMRSVLIHKRIDDASYSLLRQLSTTLSSLYETYTRNHDIVESIVECKKGPFLVKPFESIHTILTDVNSEDKLNEFYATSPFRLLRTLATTAQLLNREGDVKDEQGQYAFQQAITLIKSEVDDEIRKQLKQRTMFQMLEYLPLAPIVFIGPLQSFFIANIPGTSVMYQGLLGYVSRILIVLTSFVAFYIITTINRQNVVREDDRFVFILELMAIPKFKKFVKTLLPKKNKEIHAWNKKLRGALSSQNLEYVFATKAVFSAIGVVFATFAVFITLSSAKQFTYQNVKSLSFTGGTSLTVEEEANLKALDAKYMDSEYLPDDNTLNGELKAALPKKSEMDILEQVERVKKKYNTYHNIKFRWWFVLLIYAVGVGCWFIPEALIALRKYLVKTEAEEDVLQMQTLIAILMHTPLDTLDTLYWLEKNSTVHKDALRFAYHEYPSDPEMALNRLKSKSAIPEFISLCDKLLSTVVEVTLKEAFPDLISQRDHIMKMRETVQNDAIEKKRRLASPVALAPLVCLILGHVLMPIGILGVQEFTNTLGSLGAM